MFEFAPQFYCNQYNDSCFLSNLWSKIRTLESFSGFTRMFEYIFKIYLLHKGHFKHLKIKILLCGVFLQQMSLFYDNVSITAAFSRVETNQNYII